MIAAVGSQASAESATIHPPRGAYGWHGGDHDGWRGDRDGWRGDRSGWRGPVYGGGWGYGYGPQVVVHRVWVPGYWVARPWGRVWVVGGWR
jgi:hypothetical protein